MNYKCESKLNDEEIQGSDAAQIVAGLAEILDDIERELRREVIMGEAEYIATTLWIAHTVVYRGFKLTPRLFATSLHENSGKSTLLKSVAAMAPGGYYNNKPTAAFLRRYVDAQKGKPLTMVVDQQDHALKNNGDLIDTLCAGADRGAHQGVVDEIDGAKVPVSMSFHVPIALGKIGCIKDRALDSRCIVIRMHPATPEEGRRLWREATGEVDPAIPTRLSALLAPYTQSLGRCRPHMPEALTNRGRDKWHPLVAVADLAGPKWDRRARWAAEQLEGQDAANVTRAARLLHMAKDIAASKGGVVFARELADTLGTPPSTLLREVGIGKAQPVRRGTEVLKGWKLQELEAMTRRYPLPDDDDVM